MKQVNYFITHESWLQIKMYGASDLFDSDADLVRETLKLIPVAVENRRAERAHA